VGARELYVPANGRVEEVDVFKAELLTDGAVVTGPAVIAGDTTTILLDQADRMTCDADSFLMEVGAQRATAARTAPTMTANA
jgi:N-methylhydantoinase A/oxoprolinase/acetone carboxylase beta subunit